MTYGRLMFGLEVRGWVQSEAATQSPPLSESWSAAESLAMASVADCGCALNLVCYPASLPCPRYLWDEMRTQGIDPDRSDAPAVLVGIYEPWCKL